MHKQLNLLDDAKPAGDSAGRSSAVHPAAQSDWRLSSDTKAAGRNGLAQARAALEAGRQALAAAKEAPKVERVVHPGRPSTLLPSPARPDIVVSAAKPSPDADDGRLDFPAAA